MTAPDPPRDAERALLLLHLPAGRRAAMGALLALHDRLAHVATGGREPMLRRIRLAWWRDALAALDTEPPPAEPLLCDLAAALPPVGIGGARLAGLSEGWDELFAEPLDEAALARFAKKAGDGLFALAAVLLGGTDGMVQHAGRGWALTELARRLPPGDRASMAAEMAKTALDRASTTRWPRRPRALAMLAALARSDLAGARPNTPARAALLWRVRLIGR